MTQISYSEQSMASAITGTPTSRTKNSCPVSNSAFRLRHKPTCCSPMPGATMQ